MAAACAGRAPVVLRFQLPRVNLSDGSYDHGIGELEDARRGAGSGCAGDIPICRLLRRASPWIANRAETRSASVWSPRFAGVLSRDLANFSALTCRNCSCKARTTNTAGAGAGAFIATVAEPSD